MIIDKSKRQWLGVIAAGVAVAGLSRVGIKPGNRPGNSLPPVVEEISSTEPEVPLDRERLVEKAVNFDMNFPDDIYTSAEEYALLISVTSRLERAQAYIGHANFSLLSVDELRRYAKNVSSIGEFTPREMEFIEQIFSFNATQYGFLGERINTRLTEGINRNDVIKVPGSGQYLFKGKSEQLFLQIQNDIGTSVQLTSGIRSVVKQLHLFLAKAIVTEGNLSRASRSLANTRGELN